MNSIGAGDKLARGMAKAQFPASEKTKQQKWDEAFKDFDPETFEMPNAKKFSEDTEINKSK